MKAASWPRSAAVEAPRAALVPGLRIDVERNLPPLATRVVLSAGTQTAVSLPDMAPLYVPHALIPRRPWREASAEELHALRFEAGAGDSWRMGADAAIVRPPQALVASLTTLLERHRARERIIADAHLAIEADPDWTESVAALRRYLTLRYRTPFDWAILRIADPNLFTLTQGDDRGQRIGIHLDSWNRQPLRHRHRSCNRICINLGRESRALLLLNLPLIDMFHALDLRDPEDMLDDFRGLRLGARFMQARPDYPVLRLRVDSGEAYILPTDNVMHDASTDGNRYPDITLTFIGRVAHRPNTR